MEFTTAYILGVQRRNDYFGDSTAQYRSVDTISIEGYIDVRSSNSDYKGVRQALDQIDSYVAASAGQSVTENIIINGTGFGTGRLLTINFPASTATDENQILYGKYTADIEIYNSGNIGETFESPTRDLTTVVGNNVTDVFTKNNHNLLNGLEVEITFMDGTGPSLNTRYYVGNVTTNTFKLYEDPSRTVVVDIGSNPFSANIRVYYIVPFPEFLDSFSENFSVELGEDDIYNLQHSLDITYVSGVEKGGTAIDPIATAKSLAINLFDQTPTQFSTVIPPSYGSISEASRKYFTESYNRIDGSTTFEKRFSLLPSGLSTYSLQLSNNFSFDEQGIVTVSEDGEIAPRSPQFINEATEALDAELTKSYQRCSDIYDSYKNYLGSNSSTLYTQAVSKNKTLNNSNGTSSYSVQYTDNLNIQNLTTVEERNIVLDTQENVTTVTENGTVTSIDAKNATFNPYPLLPSRSTVKARCQSFYEDNIPVQDQYTLKNLSNKFNIPKYGKAVTYTYSFTSDGEIFDRSTDPIFARKQIVHSDRLGAPNQSTIVIPNISSNLLHTPDQTSLGSRSTRIQAQLRRPQFTNNLETRTIPISAINSAKTDALQDAYMIFANNNVRSLDRGQIYVTSANYSFDSDNTFNMTLESTFTMQREVAGEYNLAFNP